MEERRLLSTVIYGKVADALRSELSSVQGGLTTVLNGYTAGATSTIPIIGNQISSVAQFEAQLQTALNALSVTGTTIDVPTAFGQAFSSYLVNDNDGPGGPGDVHSTPPASDGSFQASMRLHVATTSTVIFDPGLHGLPLTISNTRIAVTGAIDLELGLNYTGGSTPSAVIDHSAVLTGGLAGSGHQLALSASAGLMNFSATATLGFVQGTLTSIDSQPNSLTVAAAMDNLDSAASLASLTFIAHANLQLTGGFSGSGVGASSDFPSISTQIHLDWDTTPSITSSPTLSFDHVSLNLGQFVNNVLGPVLKDIQSATAPLNGVINLLDQPLPVLSDLSHVIGGGDVTLMDLGKLAASSAGLGPIAGLIAQIATFVHDFDEFKLDSVSIDLGGFNLNGQDVQDAQLVTNNPGNLTNFDLSHFLDVATDYSSKISGLPSGVQDSLRKLTSELNPDNNAIDLEFPILDKPAASVFAMLIGRDSDLFTLKANLHVAASEDSGFDVFGMGLAFNGNVQLDGQLTFGYDTFGLREILKQAAAGGTIDIASDIADGFYIDDTSNLAIAGGIGITAGISAGILSADVAGSIGTPSGKPITVSIDTSKDVDGDGKLRFGEIPSKPLLAFKVGGELDAGLTFQIKVGFEVFGDFIGFTKDFDIASTVVFQFDSPSTQPSGVILASQPGDVPGSDPGAVTLYIGQLAGGRIGPGVNQTDGNEIYTIRHISGDARSSDGEAIEIDAFSQKQIIDHVHSIVGNGDVGDLTIEVEPDVTAPVFFKGGQGSATLNTGAGGGSLTAGQAGSSLSAGAGNTNLVGREGSDTFFTGQSGFDNIKDEGGDNYILVESPGAQFNFQEVGQSYFNTLEAVVGISTVAVTATPDGNDTVDLQFVDFNQGIADDVVSSISRLIIVDKYSTLAINIGDMAAAGITHTLVDITGGNTGESINLATAVNSDATLLQLTGITSTYPDPRNQTHNVTEQGLSVVNDSGTTTDVLGAFGTLDITQNGGTADIANLNFGPGTIFFDIVHNGSFGESFTLTTPAVASGSTVTVNNITGFRIQATGEPAIVILGMASDDTTTLNVSAAGPGGTNTVTLDASALSGVLNVNALGSQLVNDTITVSGVGQQGFLNINGESTSTTVTVGDGELAPIQGRVFVTQVALSIDDSEATTPSILTMDTSSFQGWDYPSTTAKLIYSDLDFGTDVNVYAGPGDRFDLEGTPLDVHNVTFHFAGLTNPPDEAYVAQMSTLVDSTVHLIFDGGFALFLGERLTADGTVTKLSSLEGLANTTITYDSTPPEELRTHPNLVTFWNPTGQHYVINGNGDFVVTDQTVLLTVIINHYRSDDQVSLDLPGGTVDADLTKTGPGIISIDGSARLGGANVSVANNITVHTRAGAIIFLPTGENDAKLIAFDTLYLLGSLPQDNFDVYDANNVIAVANDAVPQPFVQFKSAGGNPTSAAAGQPFDFTVVAADINGTTLTGYTGQVQSFTYNQTTQTYLTSDYQSFAPGDLGQHVFHLLLADPGIYTVGFDDGSHTNSFTLNVMAPPQANLVIDIPSIPADLAPVAVAPSDPPTTSSISTPASPIVFGPVAVSRLMNRTPVTLPSLALATHLATIKAQPAKAPPRKPGPAKRSVKAPPQHPKEPLLKRNK